MTVRGQKQALKGGRPSKYTPELVETIAARMSQGEPLAQICRDEGMPHPSTVRDWMAAREDVSRAIARAREDGFDAIAVEALRIADECRIGEKGEYDKDGVLIKKQTGDMIERARLQVDTRLKLLAKWDPRRYGDFTRTELTGLDGGALKVETTNIAEIDGKIAALLAANPELLKLTKAD